MIWIVSVAIVAVIVVVAAYFWLNPNLTGRTAEGVNINIANCGSISPQSTSVAIGQPIIFKNDDETNHIIFIGGVSINVLAGASSSLSSVFPYGAGPYGYICDGKLTANQIVVTNK